MNGLITTIPTLPLQLSDALLGIFNYLELKVLNSQNHKRDSQLPFDWTPVYKLIVFVVVSKWSKSFFHREIQSYQLGWLAGCGFCWRPGIVMLFEVLEDEDVHLSMEPLQFFFWWENFMKHFLERLFLVWSKRRFGAYVCGKFKYLNHL